MSEPVQPGDDNEAQTAEEVPDLENDPVPADDQDKEVDQ